MNGHTNPNRAHVIVVGNEKGGSGKSTTAMHIAVAMLQEGQSVATIDIDARQGTLSRYVANRERYVAVSGNAIEVPKHYVVDPIGDDVIADQQLEKLRYIIEGAWVNHDVIVIDAPGSDSALSRLAHSYADTLITPINDSLIDFDVLAYVDGANMSIKAPNHYAEMVWEQKKVRAQRDGGTIDWVVLRNRISSLDTHNARDVDRLVKELSKRIGFRAVPGLSERVIFRELFLVGLTILDLKDASGAKALSQSHYAARQEVFGIVNSIGFAKARAAS
jgi:chromosome partitioning protein